MLPVYIGLSIILGGILGYLFSYRYRLYWYNKLYCHPFFERSQHLICLVKTMEFHCKVRNRLYQDIMSVFLSKVKTMGLFLISCDLTEDVLTDLLHRTRVNYRESWRLYSISEEIIDLITTNFQQLILEIDDLIKAILRSDCTDQEKRIELLYVLLLFEFKFRLKFEELIKANVFSDIKYKGRKFCSWYT